ncbi:lysophospholipid acyltransferase family protein [Amaricoccus macauensis]|uniref:lysophospholipid acyltransferase family protein n=1 Tax=Amaricoccus macauensis TaxID=57001 RepID=UPI003C7DE6A7
MTIGWNEAVPPELPPLRQRERLRLALRGIVAVLTLLCLFGIFLLVRGAEMLVAKVRGRRSRRASNRIVQVWARTALPNLGLRYVQRGTPLSGAGGFVANHSSWIDIVVLQRAAVPFLVSKSEVRDWPGIGFIGRAIGTLFIDRKATAAKRQEAELLERIRAGDRMALFPEGTSTDGQRVLPFKSSLFAVFFSRELETVTVQPVAITYHPAAGLPASFYSWWGEMDFAAHLIDILARSKGGVVEIDFLDPVAAEETTGRKEMAFICGQRVRSAFDSALPSGQSRVSVGSKVSATPFMQ